MNKSKDKVNRCTGIIDKGRYEGDNFELIIHGPTSKDVQLKINGTQLNNVTGIWIKLIPGCRNKMTFEILAK